MEELKNAVYEIEYLVKKINTSFLTGVMNVEIIKFYPLYPYNI